MSDDPGVESVPQSALREKTPLVLTVTDEWARRRDQRRRDRWLRVGVGCFATIWCISGVIMGYRQLVPGTEEALNASSSLSPLTNTTTGVRILIIRHCDKDGSRRHCSEKGYRRSAWLPTLFVGPDRRYPTPSLLFARAPEPKHYVLRSVETLEPLAAKIDVPINVSYSASTVDSFIDMLQGIVASGKFEGHTALICWKHEQIPEIAYRLGFMPTDRKIHKKSGLWTWKGSDYDTILDINISRAVSHLVGKYAVQGAGDDDPDSRPSLNLTTWLVKGHFSNEGYVDDDPHHHHRHDSSDDNKKMKKSKKKKKKKK